MKKLYGIVLLLTVLSISLVGCKSPTELNTGLTEKEILESVEKYCKTDIISQELVCDTSEVKDTRVLAVLSAYEDTTQYPSYMLDYEGNYVSMLDLGELLKMKYFELGVNQYDIFSKRNGSTFIRISNVIMTDYNENDLFVKLFLMMEELSNYNYYILNNDVTIMFVWYDTAGIQRSIELTTSSENLLSDTLYITPDGFFTGYLEMSYDSLNVTISQLEVNSIYETYKTDSTYSGYVLNYTE